MEGNANFVDEFVIETVEAGLKGKSTEALAT